MNAETSDPPARRQDGTSALDPWAEAGSGRLSDVGANAAGGYPPGGGDLRQGAADDAAAPVPVDAGSARPPRRLLRGSEQLSHLVGARLLVGVTFRGHGGEVVRTDQFCGRVIEVSDGVVVVERGEPGSEQAFLPAEVGAYEQARPGRYVLASTGEAVIDPDYLTVWDVEIGSDQ